MSQIYIALCRTTPPLASLRNVFVYLPLAHERPRPSRPLTMDRERDERARIRGETAMGREERRVEGYVARIKEVQGEGDGEGEGEREGEGEAKDRVCCSWGMT